MPKKTFYQLPEEKKHQIMGGAILEFYEKKYEDISITSLIKRMDIPTGSFYQYFEDKKDVYFYVLSMYQDRLLEESNAKDIKLDLLNKENNLKGLSIFSDIKKDPMYYKICVENFNATPDNIKRDWSFEVVMKNYMSLYDFSIFDDDDIPDIYKENKELLMSLSIVVPSVVRKFVTRDENPEKYSELYHMCINIIKEGILSGKTVENNSI